MPATGHTRRYRTSVRMAQRKRRSAPADLWRAVEAHQLDLEIGNRAQGTRDWYTLVIKRYVAWLVESGRLPSAEHPPLSCLSLEAAKLFVLHIKETPATNQLTGVVHKRSSKTVLEHVRALKAFSRYCFDEGLMPNDALRSFRSPRVVQRTVESFTADQVRDLLRVIPNHHYSERNQAIILFLLATGVRVSELCNLTVADLDMRARKAKILGKGSKERWVYFDPITAKALTRWLSLRPETSYANVFLNRTGDPYNRNSLRKLLEVFGQEAGIPFNATPHIYRHTFALMWLKGHPGQALQLQELLGHTNLTMTMRYVKMAEAAAASTGIGPVEAMALGKLLR